MKGETRWRRTMILTVDKCDRLVLMVRAATRLLLRTPAAKSLAQDLRNSEINV